MYKDSKSKLNDPLPKVNVYDSFLKDNFNIQPFLESRQKTSEVRKTLDKYQGDFGLEQKKHLLNRTMVGFASRHLKDLEGLNLEEAIDLIFTQHEIGEPINNYHFELSAEEYEKKYGNKDVGPGEKFVSRPIIDRPIMTEAAGVERINSLNSWLYQSIIEQPTSVEWKLFLFLHNLTPSDEEDTRIKPTYYAIKLTYEGAWRSYKDYIYDVTLSPLMMDLLNLKYSKKEAPDENFAREVQELFTVGKRPFSKFTEKDVHEASRLLVGWTYGWQTFIGEGFLPEIQFDPNNHDTEDKQFSEFYNNKLIKGRTGEAGRDELKEFYDMIFETQEASIYLSRRLVQFFIYPVLNDYVEENIIIPLAEVMRNNDYSLSETLKVLLKSEYFYAEEFYNCLIKSPLEFNLGILKELDILNGEISIWDNEKQIQLFTSFEEDKEFLPSYYYEKDFKSYKFISNLRHYLNAQGLNINRPPGVAGWPAYYQEPVYDLIWINSDTIKQKKQFMGMFVQNGIPGYNENLRYDLNIFLNKFSNPKDIDAFLSEIIEKFVGIEIPPNAYNKIKAGIIPQGFPDYYWSDIISDFLDSPSKNSRNTLVNRINQILLQVFDLNEIHIF